MLKTTNFISLSTISKSSIDAADEDEGGKSGSNKTNLLNSFALKKSIKAAYLTSKGTKKGGNKFKKIGDNIKTMLKPLKAPIT